MDTEQNLADAISNYIGSAKVLEGTRQSLVGRIRGVVKTDIVPEISRLLPPGYSIDADRIDVNGVGEPLPNSNIRNPTYGTVPTGFYVSLRLLYDGKPMPFPTGENIGEIGQIRRDLKPKLEELAQRYNLDCIIPMGEPGKFLEVSPNL